MDDTVVTRDSLEERKTRQRHLSRKFEMKDLSLLWYFLGIEVFGSIEEIYLFQKMYVLDLLEKTRMLGCQLVDTLVEKGLKLNFEPIKILTNIRRYQGLVGRLMYLSHTRLNLAYSLSVVSLYLYSLGI